MKIKIFISLIVTFLISCGTKIPQINSIQNKQQKLKQKEFQIVVIMQLVTMQIKQKYRNLPKWMPTTLQLGAKAKQPTRKTAKCSVICFIK